MLKLLNWFNQTHIKMKKNHTVFLIFQFIVLALLLQTSVLAQDRLKNLPGAWAGTLTFQGIELRLVMNVSFNEGDSMIVTFDSPDQGAKDIPTSKVILREDSILVSSKIIGGKFSGKINADYSAMAGTWWQGGKTFPLNMVKQEKPVTLHRPQEPKPPYPYRSQEITFKNTTGGFELAGTLTLPEKVGRHPAVILITGSGPQNRDEELLGHKPFLVISDYLTRQGIAVLRYDDRGIAKSGGVFKTATTLDFATDAESALDFLKHQPEIDTNMIGFIGHSEGGIIAPIVASRRPDVAFIILMAGPGLTGAQIVLLQSELISKAEGMDEKSIKSNGKLNRDIFSALKKNQDNARAEKKIRALFDAADKKNASDTGYQKLTDQEVASQIENVTSPWFRCFLTLNPEVYLSQVRCPLLAINGSLDLQVPPKENLQAIEKALIFGGNSHYLIEELPGLNHLFQTATTGSPTEYAKIEETISPAALDVMGNWIRGTRDE
jgi:pimeloyl-ACP methyl ester carboxylesterase